MISAIIKGAENLRRDIRAEGRRARYALNLAVRVEGFRLMRELKKEIRAGAAGGHRFAPLSVIARKRLHRGRNEPLRRLSVAVRYHLKDRDPAVMEIGWTGPRVSKRWKYLAKAMQTGFTTPVTDRLRRSLLDYGATMRDRKNRKYFMLRKSTQQLKTPARPILEPFWRAHEAQARRNIAINFRRKMKGERI